MERYNPTELIGVNAVEKIVLEELRWIFRAQPIADMGIDAHIELVDGQPTGQLAALQIKSGKGNFRETADTYVYYGDPVHLDYWAGHSLPVILVAHLPETGETLWAVVDEGTVERTARAWKLAIPKRQRFGAAARAELAQVFDGTPHQQKLRRLAIHEPLMRHVARGHKVSIELEDWHNKSQGRTPVQVVVHDERGRVSSELAWFTYFTGMSVKDLAERLFPWATAHVDVAFYEEHNDSDLAGPKAWAQGSVYPYSHHPGEAAVYRLQLALNDFGRAYLTVADFLETGP